MKLRCLLPLTLALSLSFPIASAAEERESRWTDEIVELFSTLPVQDGGRIKPMDSVAGLHLLTLNGKRTLVFEDETKLDPNRWLLDVFFFPELARTYPCFRVQNDGVLTIMGLPAKKKRDWYSYDELNPGRDALRAEAQQAVKVDAAERDGLQRQTLKLAGDMASFDSLASLLALSRHDYPTDGDPKLVELFGEKQPGAAWFLSRAADLQEFARAQPPGNSAHDAVFELFGSFDGALAESFRAVTLFPPPQPVAAHDHAGHDHGAQDHDGLTWWRPHDVLLQSFQAEGLDLAPQVELLALLEQLDATKEEPAAFAGHLRTFHEKVVSMARARGEYKQIPLEVSLYRWDPFTKSLVFYLLAFLIGGLGLLMPQVKGLRIGSAALVGLAVAAAIFGIVLRCIIRSRPPVVSLYDTILFITSVVVLVVLFMEWITRSRVILFLGSFLGAAGMFLAGRYELKEVASSGDTMASVVAVLDTNYYLAIHVTTISMGYAGGLLAAGIAHVWILGKLFGIRKGDRDYYKGIARMIYGTVCFTLLFSLFGTIMGGVWANDSWGRFWGWDPKENGALLIVIWMILILHARLGGFIRERGLANLAIFGGVVVSFSWWGVNLLNVGLHSYGFTSGVAVALFILWASQALVLGLSGLDHLRSAPKAAPEADPEAEPEAPAAAEEVPT